MVFYKPHCSTISFPFYTTKLVICFQLSMERLCAYQLECHGYTALCFLSNLSGVPGIRQQIPIPLESSPVEQSEFREVVWSTVDLLPCLKSVIPLGAFSVTFAIPNCLKGMCLMKLLSLEVIDLYKQELTFLFTCRFSPEVCRTRK